MANNYTQVTVEPDLRLSDVQKVLLKALGFSTEPGDKTGTFYVFAEECYNEVLDNDAWENVADDVCNEDSELLAPFVEWDGESLMDLLRVLCVENKIPYIEMNAAYTCSKLRPGEFGGFKTLVTPTHWAVCGNSDLDYDEKTKLPTFSGTIHEFPLEGT